MCSKFGEFRSRNVVDLFLNFPSILNQLTLYEKVMAKIVSSAQQLIIEDSSCCFGRFDSQFSSKLLKKVWLTYKWLKKRCDVFWLFLDMNTYKLCYFDLLTLIFKGWISKFADHNMHSVFTLYYIIFSPLR
jgi:hypothetical protein